MKSLLNDMSAVPGVIGGLIFDTALGIRDSSMPPRFKADALNSLAGQLARLLAMGTPDQADISEMCLVYETVTILIKKTKKTECLALLCGPSSDLQRIAEQVNQGLGSGDPGQNSAGQKISRKEAEVLISSSPVSPRLQEMQAALFEIAGPMAKIIFLDAVREWVRQREPSEASIPDLVQILTRNIDDPAKAMGYVEKISP